MQAFLTGANGFIGTRLVQQLTRRGDTVVCLVRDPARAQDLAKMGAQLVRGDITDRASLQAPMRGADIVVHLAGLYKFGPQYLASMRAINVDGARNVLETAVELGVPKIIHTSTVGVFGNTHSLVVDETYRSKKEDLVSEYERTKWEAHYEVAVPLQLQGAPVIITQPGGVTGPGDASPHMQPMEFYLSRLPIGFGANSGMTMAHVDDIAWGHILAAERGQPGAAYIIAGQPMTWRQTMQLWQKITGVPAPRVWVPGWMVGLNASALGLLERTGARLPFAAEAIATLADYTFWATSDKARRELGWQPRPAEEMYREVLAYEMSKRGMPAKFTT